MKKIEFEQMAKASDEIVAKARLDKSFAKQFLRELGLVDSKGQITAHYKTKNLSKTSHKK